MAPLRDDGTSTLRGEGTRQHEFRRTSRRNGNPSIQRGSRVQFGRVGVRGSCACHPDSSRNWMSYTLTQASAKNNGGFLRDFDRNSPPLFSELPRNDVESSLQNICGDAFRDDLRRTEPSSWISAPGLGIGVSRSGCPIQSVGRALGRPHARDSRACDGCPDARAQRESAAMHLRSSAAAR